MPTLAQIQGANQLFSPQTAQQIDAKIAQEYPSSPLKNQGMTFVAAGKQYGVDPYFLAAISISETAAGTYGPSQPIHNPFGLGPGLSFPNYSSAIYYAAKNLAGPPYSTQGATTIPKIAAIWAPTGASNDPGGLNKNWTGNVTHYYELLSGGYFPIGGTVVGTGIGGLTPIGSGKSAIGGAVSSAAGDAASGIESALGVATAGAGIAVKVLEWLANPIRILEMFVGLSLLFFGVIMLFRYGTSTGQTVGKAATSAVIRTGVKAAIA